MDKKLLGLLVGVLALTATACSTATNTPVDETPDTETPVDETPDTRTDDWLPFSYPETATTAEAGDWVLVPNTEMLDEAFELGTADDTIFIFYTATMVTPGETSSLVEDPFGDQYSLNNALIVPLKKGQTAKKGELLITWWQSGSGLMRAVAQADGTAPTVVYLADITEPADTLEVDSFHKLTGELEPGIGVAVNTGTSYDHATLINISGDKAIVSGFAGSLEVVDASALTPMPANPGIAVGDTFQGPIIGSYGPVTAKSVDAAKGMVVGEYEFAGSMSEETFYFGEIIKTLE